MIIIRYESNGRTIEVAKDEYGFVRKVRGFRIYDKALKFAENLSLRTGDALVNYALPYEEAEEAISEETPEERLRRAIFGDTDDGVGSDVD